MDNLRQQKSAEDSERLDLVLESWDLQLVSFKVLETGLINKSFKVDVSDGRTFVLQKISDRFSAEVTGKIHRLTSHLESSGLKTFHVLEGKNGQLIETYKGESWRLLSFLEGLSLSRVQTNLQASEAGALLARFHLALEGYEDEDFRTTLSSHDIHLHLTKLEKAVRKNKAGPFYSEVKSRAEILFTVVNKLPPMTGVTLKVLHGDPKISNFLFSADKTKAECILDLDTVGPASLPLELGDAFRSWCNPIGEDGENGFFDSDLFKSAFESYANVAGRFLSQDVREELVLGTLYVYFELSARFLLDVLEEKNFGWDPARFSSSAEHNLVRAKGQFNAGQDLIKQFDCLSRYAKQYEVAR